MKTITNTCKQLAVSFFILALLLSIATPASAATPSQASLSQLQTMLETIKSWIQPQVKGVATITVTNDAELATAIKNATGGETIELAPGSYGTIHIQGGQYNQVSIGGIKMSGAAPTLSSKVIITSKDPNNPAVVKSIDIRQNDNWHFNNLDIRPGNRTKSFFAVDLDGANLVFENSTISYGDYTKWLTNTDWAIAGGAIMVSGKDALVKNNFITGVYHGVFFLKGAAGSKFLNNTLDGIGGDASRVLADNMLVEKNFFKNFYVNDGNHDDCMQSYGTTGGSPDQNALIVGVTIRSNICLQTTTNNLSDPMLSYPQGYGAFDGSMQNWLVENNVYVSTAYHGMAYSGATNQVMKNNTIIDSDPAKNGADTVWIRVSSNKGGSIPPTGNTITDNISNKFPINTAPAVTTFSNNKTVKIVDYDKYFRNWKVGDVRLLASSPIQGTGANLDPATVGSNRSLTNPSAGGGTTTPPPTPTDTDNDGVADATDNCVTVSNANQANFDNDTQGDACDTDDDNDGILDTAEKSGCVLNPSTTCGTTTTPGAGGGTSTSTSGASLTLTLNPVTITTGGKATLSWTSSNVSTCTASGAWTGSKLRSGTQSTGIISTAGTRTYTLSCTGTGGTVSKSVTLTVTGSTPGGDTPTSTSTPTTSCKSGDKTYPAGTSLQTIINPDGTSKTIADASFVCTNGQWVVQGGLPGPSTGTRVVTTDTVNVRGTANGTVLGTQPAGRLGTRSTAAPITAGGYQWVHVNFDTNPDGYVASQFVSTTLPGTTPTAGGMTQTEINAKIQELLAEIAKLQALLTQLRAQ